jgi:hypothetical protein
MAPLKAGAEPLGQTPARRLGSAISGWPRATPGLGGRGHTSGARDAHLYEPDVRHRNAQ